MTDFERLRLRRMGIYIYRAADHGRHGYMVEDVSAKMWFPSEEEAEGFIRLAGLLE